MIAWVCRYAIVTFSWLVFAVDFGLPAIAYLYLLRYGTIAAVSTARPELFAGAANARRSLSGWPAPLAERARPAAWQVFSGNMNQNLSRFLMLHVMLRAAILTLARLAIRWMGRAPTARGSLQGSLGLLARLFGAGCCVMASVAISYALVFEGFLRGRVPAHSSRRRLAPHTLRAPSPSMHLYAGALAGVAS